MDRAEAIEIIRKNMPSDKSLPVYEALQTLIPELAESENKRITRAINNMLPFIPGNAYANNGVTKEQVLAWLEKQKELFESGRGLYYYDGEKTIYCGYPATEENPYDFAISQQEKQKEQKPAEINEYEIIKKHITDDSLSSEVNKRLKECGWYVTDEKPAERNESDTLMCNAALELLRSHPNLMASNGINKSSIIRWLQSFRPQRQGFIDDICSKAGISIPYLDGNQWCILKGDNIQSGVVGFGDTKEDALANFIKDVPIQQKWGEEDEDMLNSCISSIEEAKENRYAYKETDGDTSYDHEIAWLKSLRPQPKKELSIEKAIKWLDDTFYFLDNSSGRGRDCEITTHDFDSLEEMYDSFRKAVIVDSEPSWKPSEEQISSLKQARDYYMSGCIKYVGRHLSEIAEQLEKLM